MHAYLLTSLARVIVIVTVCSTSVSSQAPAVQSQNAMKRIATLNHQGSIDKVEPEKKTRGNVYLYNVWRDTDIILTDGQRLTSVPAMLNLKTDQLELSSSTQIKVLPAGKVKQFSIRQSPQVTVTFINAQQLDTSTSLHGYLQILFDGKIKLLLKTELIVRKADYSVQFSVGSRDDEIIKQKQFYCFLQGRIARLPKSKRKIFKLFSPSLRAALIEYVRENRIGTANGDDLIAIFAFANERS
jgi:hypothetical protein